MQRKFFRMFFSFQKKTKIEYCFNWKLWFFHWIYSCPSLPCSIRLTIRITICTTFGCPILTIGLPLNRFTELRATSTKKLWYENVNMISNVIYHMSPLSLFKQKKISTFFLNKSNDLCLVVLQFLYNFKRVICIVTM